MSSHFVVVELYEQTVTQMTTLGSELDHEIGAERVGRHGLPNRYVWVPTKTATTKKLTLRGGEKDRPSFEVEEAFEVHCWGESLEAAIILRDNLIHAMCLAIGSRAPLRFDGCDWLFEDDDESTLGRVLICKFAIASVIADRWVPIARFVRSAPQSLVAPDAPTTEITAAVVTTYASETTAADGELAAEDDVEA